MVAEGGAHELLQGLPEVVDGGDQVVRVGRVWVAVMRAAVGVRAL